MNPSFSLSGGPLDYLFAFLGGIAVSFTPCIYPLIPVSVSLIGANAQETRLRGFFLSLFYVTGIAITYSILGIIASLSGGIFGIVSSHYLTYIAVGAIVIIFGLSMFGLFTIPLPGLTKTPVIKKKNYFSSFLLGLISGLIVSPCLTPVLGSILAYLATRKNIFYGATVLFTFAYGMGFVLILLATGSSVVLAVLPKSGNWMVYVRRIFSVILIATGVYFISIGLRRM